MCTYLTDGSNAARLCMYYCYATRVYMQLQTIVYFVRVSLYPVQSDEDSSVTSKAPKVATSFFEWCCKYFAEPVKHAAEDTESAAHYEHKNRCLQAACIQADASAELRKTRTSHWLIDWLIDSCNIVEGSVDHACDYESYCWCCSRIYKAGLSGLSQS